MKPNKKLYSVTLASVVLILFLILISSTASANTAQSASTVTPYAYITNEFSSTVSVIDTSDNNVTATVPAGSRPAGVAVNPEGTKVYVANFYLEGYGNVLSKSIDTTSALIKGTKEHVATDEGTISVIDTATNTLTATIPVGSYPIGVAVNPDGTKIYVTNRGSNLISVIDAATNTVTATINIDSGGNGVTVTPDGKKVYVTNLYTNVVYVIDADTNTITATVPVGTSPFGVTVSPDGKKVYVSNAGSDTLSVIDTATNTVSATVSIGNWPLGVAVNPDGTKVYVANYNGNSVSVIDTATNTVTATVSAEGPFGVTASPDGTKVYVANYNGNTVSVVDAATNTVTTKVNVGSSPAAFGQFIASNPVPIANFSAKPTEGKAPLNVAFTDESKGAPTKWKWNFGDGTSSTLQNVTHKYSKVGRYTVTLTATNDKGSNTVTKTNYIKVVTKPVASFSASPTSGKAPITVAFTDKSSGIPTSWKWTFGDGSSSTTQNPEHQYLQEGNYKVTLTVTNVVGSNTTTKTNYIKVTTNTRPGIYSINK